MVNLLLFPALVLCACTALLAILLWDEIEYRQILTRLMPDCPPNMVILGSTIPPRNTRVLLFERNLTTNYTGLAIRPEPVLVKCMNYTEPIESR